MEPLLKSSITKREEEVADTMTAPLYKNDKDDRLELLQEVEDLRKQVARLKSKVNELLTYYHVQLKVMSEIAGMNKEE